MDDHRSIKKQAISSTIWKFLERFIAQGVSFVVSLIIARILIPDDYSVVSIVTIFFAFANVLISGGLNTALIQKKNADELDYSTIFHISVFIAVLVYIILFFLAPVIANIYHKSDLVSVIRVMGLILPVTAIKSIYSAYISSHLQFKKFFFATLGGTIVSAFVGIWMALTGFGPWALVAQQMTNTAIDTVILVICTHVGITMKISMERFRSLFRYSWKILVSNLLGTVYSEVSPLAIGLKFSATDLAFYTKGKSFPTLLSTTTTNTLASVLFPVMAKFQDEKDKILKYTRLYIRLSSFITFPFMLGLFGVSRSFVLTVLTEKWLPSVYYIKIFCLCNMFDITSAGNCETIKAIGRSDVYLKMEIVKKVGYFLTLAVFLVFSKSPEILAVATCVCVLIQIVVNSIPNITLIGYKLKYQLEDLLPNLFSAGLMCAAILLVEKLSLAPLITLIIQILVGIMIYFAIAVFTKNSSLLYIFQTVKNMTRRDQQLHETIDQN